MPSAAASTYADYLQSLVQAVASSEAGQPPCFRFDSHINPNYSLDFDASTSALVFRNNWGAAPVAYGYVCFAYGVAVYGAYTSSFATMDGSTVALDEYGGHRHDASSPYHYHSQVMDPPVSAGVPYKLHVLGNVGACRGNIVDVPNFWNGDKVADTMGQSTIWVKGQ